MTRAKRDGLEVIASEEQCLNEVREAHALRIFSALAGLGEHCFDIKTDNSGIVFPPTLLSTFPKDN
jgi:hypothetical protein